MTYYSYSRDLKLRKLKKQNEKILLLIKSFLHNEKISKFNRIKLMLKFSSLSQGFVKNSKNRCMFTKEVRAVSRITNLAKSSFKNSLS
jgi:hypothetical protein